MSTAIITGASAGMGQEFVRQLQEFFPEIRELWLIARRQERLEAMARDLGGELSVFVLPLDLTAPESFDALQQQLSQRQPQVCLLINNAGCGYLGNVGEMDVASQTRMTELNVTALTAVTTAVLPYMSVGSHIINLSSIASFCPNPRMTVYSATKAYVSAFSRGLGEELRSSGITVTAVCPGPMDTEFLALAGTVPGASPMFDTLPHSDPAKVVRGAYQAARAGKAVYTHRGLFKLYRVLAKLLPHSLLVKFTKT